MDADDVTQEVLIRIWKNINKFNVLSAKTWIMKTTHNLCIDFLRKRSSDLAKNPWSVDDISDFIENSDAQNPALTVEGILTEQKIQNAVEQLPEKLKSVFVLYEIQGMKYREISKILEMPINSVKVYLMRARKQLQVSLNEIKIQEAI